MVQAIKLDVWQLAPLTPTLNNLSSLQQTANNRVLLVVVTGVSQICLPFCLANWLAEQAANVAFLYVITEAHHAMV